MKDRQYNDQKGKKPMTYKTLDRKLKMEQQNTEVNRCFTMVSSSSSGTSCVTVKRLKHHLIWTSSWAPVYVDNVDYVNMLKQL